MESSFHPITPIVGLAMQVRDCQHKDVTVVDAVDERIGETAEPAAADTFAERMPGLRKASDAVCRRQHLNQKRITQARPLRSVPWPDRVRSRRSQETGPSPPVLGDDVAQVFGRKLTAPVGRETLARLRTHS